MFTTVRSLLVAAVLAMALTGGLIATIVIDAASTGSPSALTTPGALAAATRRLPADWTVRPGDTFTTIATANHLTVDQLQALNPRQDPTMLVPGQHLRLHLPGRRVPPPPRRVLPGLWTVRHGDTYSSIAARTGLAVADIATFNPKANPNALVPGQRLKLRP